MKKVDDAFAQPPFYLLKFLLIAYFATAALLTLLSAFAMLAI